MWSEGVDAKKVRRDIYGEDVKADYGSSVIYLAPERIQRNRLSIMKNCAKKNGFQLNDTFSDKVTHIVTEFEEEEQVIRSLKLSIEDWFAKERPMIVNTKWFIESVKQGNLVPRRFHHCLKAAKQSKQGSIFPAEIKIQPYACQRINPLVHHNHKLTKALEILAEEAEFKDDARNAGRALAFQKAASVLKSLPYEITKIGNVGNLKDIGKHSLNVIKEILEEGKCQEVNDVLKSEWFQAMKLFNRVYGVGPTTANKWYSMGMRTIEDVKSTSDINWRKDKRIDYGLAFYEDLSQPVTKKQAESIIKIVEDEAKEILPNTILYLTGGFRRGKTEGHDVDMLLSHPSEGKEIGLLATLLEKLKEKGHILHGDIEHKPENFSTLDNFEKSFLIFKDYFQQNTLDTMKNIDENLPLNELTKKKRNWIARRVDIVVCPYSQLAYALVGWTGNKHFNRTLKDYAKKEKNMKLNSNALYDFVTNQYLPASTEQEIFAYLDLPYYEPYYRNA